MIVGWHAGPKPGPMDGAPVFANVTTDAMEVAKVAAMKAIAESNGKAGVVVFADSAYAIAIAKGRAMESWIKKCEGCKVLAFEDTPLADTASRVPQPTTTLLQQLGPSDPFAGDQRPLLRFMGPSPGRRIEGRRRPAEHFSGDGSESAYQRFRNKDYQARPCPSRSTCRARSSPTN